MALITGCYEPHVSGALLPNVNDCRHRNFHDYHKKSIPRGKRRYKCVDICTTAHIPVCMQYCILYMQIQSYCREFVIACKLELHDILTPQVYYSIHTVKTVYQYVCVAMCAF